MIEAIKTAWTAALVEAGVPSGRVFTAPGGVGQQAHPAAILAIVQDARTFDGTLVAVVRGGTDAGDAASVPAGKTLRRRRMWTRSVWVAAEVRAATTTEAERLLDAALVALPRVMNDGTGNGVQLRDVSPRWSERDSLLESQFTGAHVIGAAQFEGATCQNTMVDNYSTIRLSGGVMEG